MSIYIKQTIQYTHNRNAIILLNLVLTFVTYLYTLLGYEFAYLTVPPPPLNGRG